LNPVAPHTLNAVVRSLRKPAQRGPGSRSRASKKPLITAPAAAQKHTAHKRPPPKPVVTRERGRPRLVPVHPNTKRPQTPRPNLVVRAARTRNKKYPSTNANPQHINAAHRHPGGTGTGGDRDRDRDRDRGNQGIFKEAAYKRARAL